MPTPTTADELARIRRLGEPPVRLTGRLLAALRAGDASSSTLARRTGVSQDRVLDRLRQLVRSGVVERRERGRLPPVYRLASGSK